MNSGTGVVVEAMGFPGLMPTELLVVGLPDEVKLLIVLELVLTNTKLKMSGNSKYGPICA